MFSPPILQMLPGVDKEKCDVRLLLQTVVVLTRLLIDLLSTGCPVTFSSRK